jgi:lysozyme
MKFLQSILRLLFYAVVGSVICIVGAALFFMNWEPDRGEHPLRGIDVSHHQGPIEWHRVAQDDVVFAYLKASEGGDFQDSAFDTNWREASAVGIAWGAYHFFSLCKPGTEQAENFLKTIPTGVPMLAPVLDLEFDGNCPRRPPAAEVRAEIAAFVQTVEAATGQSVILYVPEPFYTKYLKEPGPNRRLWARSIWRSPSYAGKWTLWQYHQRGKVDGVSGDVDLNVIAPGVALEVLFK